MAGDLEKTVKILFQGEDKDLVKSIAGVAKGFDDLSGIADKISAPLADVADKIMKMDAALAAMVIGGMALAIRESIKLDEAFDAIGTTLNISKDKMGEFEGKVKEYASNSTESISAITNSISALVKKGFEYNSAIDISKQAEILAVATRSDLKSATDILAETINVYGLSAKDAGRLTDIFTVAVQQGAGALPDLAGSLGKVAGIASTAGISIEEILAAVATLGSKGIDTGSAVAGLTRTISNMLEPTSKTASVAKELGLDFSYTALKTKGFVGVLQEAYVATGGNAEKLKELFGSVRGLNVAVSLAKDEHGKFKDSLDAVGKSAGVAAGIFATESQDLDKLFQNMKNNISLFVGDIGDKLTPGVGAISKSFSDLFKVLKTEVDAGAFDPLFEAFDEAAGSFDEFIKGVAKALPEALKGLDFRGLIAAVKELFGSVGSYMDGLDLTKPEDLHIAIQGIVDTITTLIKVTDGMVEGFKPFFESIKEFVQGINSGDEESKKMAGTIMALAKAVETFGLGLVVAGEIAQKYGLSFSGAFNLIAGSAQVMWNGLQILGNAIQALFIILEGSFLTFIDMMSLGILGKYSETFKKMVAVVTESGKEISKNLDKNGLDAADGLAKMGKGLDQVTSDTNNATEAAKKLKEQHDRIADKTEKKFQLSVEQTGKMSLEDVAAAVVKTGTEIDKIPAKKTIDIEVKPDWVEIDGVITIIGKKIPDKKDVDIDVKLKADKLKEDAKLIDTAIQWKAKLDIAQVEAGTKNLSTMFDSVNKGIEGSGKLLDTLFGKLGSNGGWNDSIIEASIKSENANRKTQFDLQKQLIEQQIKMNELKISRMQDGDLAIKIDSTGLEPALEMVMWEIIKKVQIRAVESSAEFLLGINTTSTK